MVQNYAIGPFPTLWQRANSYTLRPRLREGLFEKFILALYLIQHSPHRQSCLKWSPRVTPDVL